MKYENAEIVVVRFEMTDVIATSGENESPKV